jgi:glucosamine-phosphate N-acetyltransferase
MIASICTTNVTIRGLQGPDLTHGFLEVVRSFRPCNLSFGEAAAVLRERIRRGIYTYVAEYEGHIVGTASLLVDFKFINSGGRVGIVEDVIVLPDFQGLGIGRRLMVAVERKAMELRCYKICLYCSDDLIAYYERLGFNHTDLFLRRDLNDTNE